MRYIVHARVVTNYKIARTTGFKPKEALRYARALYNSDVEYKLQTIKEL